MARLRDILVRLALVAALLLPVYFIVAALGTRFGVLDWRIGFGVMTFQYGPLFIMGAAGVALIAFLAALIIPPRRGRRLAALALVIPVLALGYGAYAANRAQNIPPIHDVSTDLENPLLFSPGVVQARAAVPGSNEIASDARLPEIPRLGPLGGRLVADVQREAYPDIQPIMVSDAPAAAYERALEAARAQGWTIGETDAAGGRFEASVQSFWYGFVDDIAVRVTPAPSGARIDVRSISRVGLSDLGANAARIRAFRQALQAAGAT